LILASPWMMYHRSPLPRRSDLGLSCLCLVHFFLGLSCAVSAVARLHGPGCCLAVSFEDIIRSVRSTRRVAASPGSEQVVAVTGLECEGPNPIAASHSIAPILNRSRLDGG